ncbi:hypothetical protein [Ciceribacter sp. RN22]|uniref:hypothetical protein n=1 Tax=Ciceribacter sp. RN22 TaxID=2954932 RepID=UPI0035AF831B
MRRAYSLEPAQLETYFSSWEEKWLTSEKDINNPKIPRSFVMDVGTLLYTDQRELDLAKAAAIRRAKTKASADRRAAKRKAQADLIGS